MFLYRLYKLSLKIPLPITRDINIKQTNPLPNKKEYLSLASLQKQIKLRPTDGTKIVFASIKQKLV